LTDYTSSTVQEACIIDQLLGDTLRPGGLDLTAHAAALAGIRTHHRVLDVGCGKGTTAVYLAQQYACSVTGIDLSVPMIMSSRARAAEKGLAGKISFLLADGENLPFNDGSFDAVMCECALSLMPHQEQAAREIQRVLKPQGRWVFTDIILRGNAERSVQNQVCFPCCLSGSSSLEEYLQLFRKTGFDPYHVEDQSDKLQEIGFHLGLALGDMDQAKMHNLYGSCRQKHRKPALFSTEMLCQFLGQSKPGYAIIIMNKI
jgi:arsenite methyltransferase